MAEHKYLASLVVKENGKQIITDDAESANNLFALAAWLEECADELRKKAHGQED